MDSERGQASVEWVGAVLAVALGLGGLVAVVPRVDGRSFGSFLAHRIACAVRGECARENDALRDAYGGDGSELVRRYAPNVAYEPGTLTLPVDFRHCRDHRCSDAPDDPDLDVGHPARGGTPATVFTHVVRDGGETFVQYWLYYPDSTTTAGNAAGLWHALRPRRSAGDLVKGRDGYPGGHADDWESYQVRIDRSGRVWVRASSHRAYQGCKQGSCRNRWVPWTGWTRVSRGSHAGHIPMRTRRRGATVVVDWPPELREEVELVGPQYPGLDLRERTTGGERLRLVPLETIDRGGWRPKGQGISPPWDKEVWDDPRSDSTG